MKLKEFYYRFAASVLSTTPQDAYELQRVLQVDKRFKKGRPGPGGGADATPFAIVFMLIAMMASGSRNRALDRTWQYWHTKTEGSVLGGWGEEPHPEMVPCPLTGEPMFGAAMQALVEDTAQARRVVDITVFQDVEEAIIRFKDSETGTIRSSRFVAEERKANRLRESGALRTLSMIGGKAIAEIADGLHEATAEQNRIKHQRARALATSAATVAD